MTSSALAITSAPIISRASILSPEEIAEKDRADGNEQRDQHHIAGAGSLDDLKEQNKRERR
jgi:hypothetical protein